MQTQRSIELIELIETTIGHTKHLTRRSLALITNEYIILITQITLIKIRILFLKRLSEKLMKLYGS